MVTFHTYHISQDYLICPTKTADYNPVVWECR